MEFGLRFNPAIGPGDRSGQQYWKECLHLVGLADSLGFTSIGAVEHYFEPYGGYSPGPLLFLTAAAQRTQKARLITGGVVPMFSHPLKLASELAMLDALSDGRLEAGFAGGLMPHEFARFGVPWEERRARFAEGVEQITRLLEAEHVTMEGRFHSFRDITILPRPVQKPRPPIWIAASRTPSSFINAGTAGHSLMTRSLRQNEEDGTMRELVGLYRDAWQKAGWSGHGRLMLAFHVMCAPTRPEALEAARAAMEAQMRYRVAAAALSTRDSVEDQKHLRAITGLRQISIETQIAEGTLLVGSPADVADAILTQDRKFGGIDLCGVQITYGTLPADIAEASMTLFAREVLPQFAGRRAVA
jgi:alkanesulfonate monooxygenase SsuD/methylene tetrahydromethanopterin reductase-like flavin-dependent oxidoreductase (luciferase family)